MTRGNFSSPPIPTRLTRLLSTRGKGKVRNETTTRRTRSMKLNTTRLLDLFIRAHFDSSVHRFCNPSTFPFDINILKSCCIIQSVRSKIELRDMLNIYRKRNSIFYFKLFIDNLFATNLHNNILRSKDNNHEEMLNIESCARKASFEA